MKIVILDRAAIGLDTPIDCLDTLGQVITYDTTSPEQIHDRIADADVIIINKIRITREILSASRLKLICIFATGFDSVDIEAARELGIGVCNVPGYSTDSVTVFTLATVLSLLTHLPEYSAFVKSGEYSASGAPNRLSPVYHDLSGKTWGIIGCGEIGGAVARVVEALGARVITYQRHTHSKYPTLTLGELASESDIITVHCPLNENSRGMINAKLLSMMKNDVILVNSARGAVLDEWAVADAVKQGRIGAFGCDVYSVEPFDTEHPYYSIRGLDNVILTPHVAWGSYEARARCINVIKTNIYDFVNGKFTNRVDKTWQK